MVVYDWDAGRETERIGLRGEFYPWSMVDKDGALVVATSDWPRDGKEIRSLTRSPAKASSR